MANKRLRPGQTFKMASIEELLGVPNEEGSTEIDIEQIHGFKDHPFKVIHDEKMEDLIASIKQNGVLTPVIVRPTGEDSYEMISGHRRMYAAQLAGLTVLPAFVREMTDDEATVVMVDANIQREELLPSEKAFAYKMKMDAMRRRAGRPTDNNSGQNDQNLKGTVSRDLLAKQVGESSKQIQRYIRLTELLPEILDLVDKKRINFTTAVEISYIDQEIQKWIHEYFKDHGFLKLNQVSILRTELMNGGVMTQDKMITIFQGALKTKAPKKKVVLSENKLRKYFPTSFTEEEMEEVIVQLLKRWRQGIDEVL